MPENRLVLQAKLLADVNRVATTIIALRGAYPRANLSAIISRTPKMLLQEPARLRADAEKVRPELAELLALVVLAWPSCRCRRPDRAPS